mgnify:FL=1
MGVGELPLRWRCLGRRRPAGGKGVVGPVESDSASFSEDDEDEGDGSRIRLVGDSEGAAETDADQL